MTTTAPRTTRAGFTAEPMTDYPFLKGHGTENDFVLLPDPDGTLHGELAATRVRALCNRRAGIGGGGGLRGGRTAGDDAPPRSGAMRGQDARGVMELRKAGGSP